MASADQVEVVYGQCGPSIGSLWPVWTKYRQFMASVDQAEVV